MDLIRRLAVSQTRGERQLSLVNELLSFREVDVSYVQIPGIYGSMSPVFGTTRLPYASLRNLRKRLISVGFVIKIDLEEDTIRMYFPEANL